MKHQLSDIRKQRLNILYQCIFCALACTAVYSISAVDAYATGKAGNALCTLIRNEMGIGGSLGKAIGTIGVLIVAVGAALGRVSWTMAVTVAVGISCLASAAWIASQLGVNGCPGM